MKILSILRFFLIAIPVFIIVYISAIGAMAIKELIKKYKKTNDNNRNTQ